MKIILIIIGIILFFYLLIETTSFFARIIAKKMFANEQRNKEIEHINERNEVVNYLKSKHKDYDKWSHEQKEDSIFQINLGKVFGYDMTKDPKRK